MRHEEPGRSAPFMLTLFHLLVFIVYLPVATVATVTAIAAVEDDDHNVHSSSRSSSGSSSSSCRLLDPGDAAGLVDGPAEALPERGQHSSSRDDGQRFHAGTLALIGLGLGAPGEESGDVLGELSL